MSARPRRRCEYGERAMGDGRRNRRTGGGGMSLLIIVAKVSVKPTHYTCSV